MPNWIVLWVCLLAVVGLPWPAAAPGPGAQYVQVTAFEKRTKPWAATLKCRCEPEGAPPVHRIKMTKPKVCKPGRLGKVGFLLCGGERRLSISGGSFKPPGGHSWSVLRLWGAGWGG